MPIPTITHLQGAVLSVIIRTPNIQGKDLREGLAELSILYGAEPAYYMLMDRLEKAKLIRSKKGKGVERHDKFYVATAKGKKEFKALVKFYKPIVENSA